jgi:hypothetical protein
MRGALARVPACAGAGAPAWQLARRCSAATAQPARVAYSSQPRTSSTSYRGQGRPDSRPRYPGGRGPGGGVGGGGGGGGGPYAPNPAAQAMFARQTRYERALEVAADTGDVATMMDIFEDTLNSGEC